MENDSFCIILIKFITFSFNNNSYFSRCNSGYDSRIIYYCNLWILRLKCYRSTAIIDINLLSFFLANSIRIVFNRNILLTFSYRNFYYFSCFLLFFCFSSNNDNTDSSGTFDINSSFFIHSYDIFIF